MAGVPAPGLSIAVANAGGMGACGILLMQPHEVIAWAGDFRAGSDGPFHLNTWVPDPAPRRNAEEERRLCAFLSNWGPAVSIEAGNAVGPDFAAQCQAMLEASPTVISSVMGLFPPDYVQKLKKRGIAWFATVSTVKEARAAEAAGAVAIIAQGAEAGGQRASFDADRSDQNLVGLFSLLPAVVDAVSCPVVATGGIADPRGVAAAMLLGASAVQIGTGFLRCPEAKIHPAWAEALATTAPEDTVVSCVFSGRAGRSIATDYVRAAMAADAPKPAPFPVQRGLTAAMRSEAMARGDIRRMQAWAGQSAALAMSAPASVVVDSLWSGARTLLGEGNRSIADEAIHYAI